MSCRARRPSVSLLLRLDPRTHRALLLLRWLRSESGRREDVPEGVAIADPRSERGRPLSHRIAVGALRGGRLADVVRLRNGLESREGRAKTPLSHQVRRVARRAPLAENRARVSRLS